MAFDFLAGCLGGCAGVLVGHPFDTVKVHLQTQNPRNPMYKGTFDCIRKIIAKDSALGLYRGVTSPMSGVAFVNAIVFGVYGNVNRHSSDPNSIQSHFIAGSLAGLVQSVICSPMELAKTHLQLQNKTANTVMHKNPLQCLNYIRKTEGFKGVFRGLKITTLRDVPGFSSYFVAYELLTRSETPPTAIQTLLAGGLAGTISWLLTFPMDVIKSRIQADGMNGLRMYSGVIDCIQKSYKDEGLAFYTRGLTSTIIRAFPMNAACFFVVSQIMKYSDRFNELNFELSAPETMANHGSKSLNPHQYHHNQTYHHHHHHHHHNYHLHHLEQHANVEELCRRKLHSIKSLLFCGALNEAVYTSELIELANDLYDDHHDFHVTVNNCNVKQKRN